MCAGLEILCAQRLRRIWSHRIVGLDTQTCGVLLSKKMGVTGGAWEATTAVLGAGGIVLELTSSPWLLRQVHMADGEQVPWGGPG